jgi:hypothetical protein
MSLKNSKLNGDDEFWVRFEYISRLSSLWYELISLTHHFDICMNELDEFLVCKHVSIPLKRSFVFSSSSISLGIRLRTNEISLKYLAASDFICRLLKYKTHKYVYLDMIRLKKINKNLLRSKFRFIDSCID